METLEQTLKNTHDWSRDRIHVLCEGGEKEIKRGLDGMMKGKKMRTLFYWIKEIMIMFLLTSMVLLTAAIGTAILLNNL